MSLEVIYIDSIYLNVLLIVMSCFTVVLTIFVAPEAIDGVVKFLKYLNRKDGKK